VDELIEVDFVHDFEENFEDGTQVGPDEVHSRLMIEQFAQSNRSIDSDHQGWVYQMVHQSVARRYKVILVLEVEPAEFTVHPAGSRLKEWDLTLQTRKSELFQHLLH